MGETLPLLIVERRARGCTLQAAVRLLAEMGRAREMVYRR
jgi:hypothetical protein